MTGVTCKRYVRAQCLLLVVLFFVVSHCRWWTPFRQHGCVRRLCLRLHYVFNIQVCNHDFRSRGFSIFHFSDEHMTLSWKLSYSRLRSFRPVGASCVKLTMTCCFPPGLLPQCGIGWVCCSFSSVLSKIIQPSPINMWPHNHLHLCRMRIGTTCTHTLLPVIGLGGYPRAYQLREFYSHRLRILVLVRTFCWIKTD